MTSIESGLKAQTKDPAHVSKLLLVGPKPPPIGGSPLTIQAILSELSSYSNVVVTLINTSPAVDISQRMTGFNVEKVRRSLIILSEYLFAIPRCDAVLVFANDLFAITLAPVLLSLARLFQKRFYLKPVAASLDLFLESQNSPFREYLLGVLRRTNGILAQTRLLQQNLAKMGLTNVYYVPGCRSFGSLAPTPRGNSAGLRLIFLGHISRLKGVLVLLEALASLRQTCNLHVTCDFYGPIIDEVHDDFLRALESVPNAQYLGVVEPGGGPELIAKYDALVLPTYHVTEGHPGVVIEAMHAGVPVIGTQVRTFPELITHGVNGLLVPTQDSQALAEAIRQLADDPCLRRRMGEANRRKGEEFRADAVVPQLLQIILPNAMAQEG